VSNATQATVAHGPIMPQFMPLFMQSRMHINKDAKPLSATLCTRTLLPAKRLSRALNGQMLLLCTKCRWSGDVPWKLPHSSRSHIGYLSAICIKFKWCQRGCARKTSTFEASSHWKLITQCGLSQWKTYTGLARKSTSNVEKINGASTVACGAIHCTCASIGCKNCAGLARKLASSVEKVDGTSIVACGAIYCTFASIDCKTCTGLVRKLACNVRPEANGRYASSDDGGLTMAQINVYR